MKKIPKILFIITLTIIIIFLIVYLFVTFFPTIGKTPNKELREEYKKRNKYYYNNTFHNIEETTLMTKEYSKSGEEIKPIKKIPVEKVESINEESKEELFVTWLGHSSILIQMEGLNILTDPVFTNITSPVNFIGPKRFSDIPLTIENTKNIDVVLISHDHYDHLDYDTIKGIDKEVKKYVVPLGVDNIIINWGISKEKIITLSWWEDTKIENLELTMTPSQHFSGRNPFKRNATLWGGYYLKNDKYKVYYTGDTGYTDTFKEVYERFGEIDLIMPDTGQYNKRWSSVHMNPEESMKSAEDVHAKNYIPIHWGSFVLSNHNWYSGAEYISENKDKYKFNSITPKIGERVNINDISTINNDWWKEIKR